MRIRKSRNYHKCWIIYITISHLKIVIHVFCEACVFRNVGALKTAKFTACKFKQHQLELNMRNKSALKWNTIKWWYALCLENRKTNFCPSTVSPVLKAPRDCPCLLPTWRYRPVSMSWARNLALADTGDGSTVTLSCAGTGMLYIIDIYQRYNLVQITWLSF